MRPITNYTLNDVTLALATTCSQAGENPNVAATHFGVMERNVKNEKRKLDNSKSGRVE